MTTIETTVETTVETADEADIRPIVGKLLTEFAYIEPAAFEKICEEGEWALYINMLFDSGWAGRIALLRVGEGATHATPPEHLPDTALLGAGWKYRFVGMMDLSLKSERRLRVVIPKDGVYEIPVRESEPPPVKKPRARRKR